MDQQPPPDLLAWAKAQEGIPAPPKRGQRSGNPVGMKYKTKKRLAEARKPLLSDDKAADLRRLLIEKAKRSIEALKLYRPMPFQEQFHASLAKERVIRGSNRAGKTLGAAVEVARALTAQDPYGRYPRTGIIWYTVGLDGKFLAENWYKKLYRAGAFKIIRDLGTGEWRAFMPNDPEDAARAKDAKPAPPLIPRRFIKEIAWESKKEGLPKVVRLHNGNEQHFFSSKAEPPRGTDIDGANFDEEIEGTYWYPEIAARLVDRSGHFIWSATPQAGTDQLFELHERAEREETLPKEKRRIEEFVGLLDNNEHLTQSQKDDLIAKLSPDEIEVRIHGQFANVASRVFPEYSQAAYEVPFFEIPREWTRYLAIDPGRQICAVLFVAIPPPDEGDYAYLYDELYIRNCSAEILGQHMKHKAEGQTFEAFLIDDQEARKTETASGRRIGDQYSEAFKRHGIRCVRTGHEFQPAIADPVAGVEAFRDWLRPRGELGPRLRVLADRCFNFNYEMKRYRYKKVGKILTDKPDDRGNVHLMACARYLAQEQPRYVQPRLGEAKPSAVWLAAQKIKKEMSPDFRTLYFGPGKTMGAGA